MYRWVDHTAELELRIEAPPERGVFEEPLAALRELIAERLNGRAERQEISVTAVDRPTLLADWLEELVFLAESEDFVAERVDELELADASLRAVVAGRRGAPRHLVKAVTYHGLEFEPEGDRWRARVVLDV